LEARRIRSGASRDHHVGDVVWLNFAAPHKGLDVDGTVTSARTNPGFQAVEASFPLPGSLAMGAQQAELDADLRTSSSLGTPSIQSIHDFYPFPLEDGAGCLLWRLTILVAVRHFLSMVTADSCFLRSESYPFMKEFAGRSTFVSFRQYLGDVRRELMQCMFSFPLCWWIPILSV
jgi:hypothetical protein